MSESAMAYTLNAWECPHCDEVNTTDADLGQTEVCQDCGEEVEIRW